jgi:rhodanese-related sulfurtransferase
MVVFFAIENRLRGEGKSMIQIMNGRFLKAPKALAIVALACLSFLSCEKKTMSQVPEVAPVEAMGLIRNDFALLVDVREADEIASGMAAPAKWIANSKIEADDASWKEFVASLPRDKQIVFYCAKGGRANKAAEKLAALGFKVGNMGGYQDWVKAGLPTRKP